MKNHKASNGGIFSRFRRKLSAQKVPLTDDTAAQPQDEKQKMLEEFDAVKRNPGHLTGWDFDRAFDFIERYPSSDQADILVGQMYATSGQLLKGLSYSSAVKVLDRMPGHAGTESIIKGMRSIERDYIKELRSDVIAYMLKIIPDHPLAEHLTAALAAKNLTNAYDFVTSNPENGYTKTIIKAMFDRDPNIAILLLQEKMDHPQVESIFEGIYNITNAEAIKTLTPNAILFILDVAPDHPKVMEMIQILVEENYVKAYDFVKTHPDHGLANEIKALILVRKPELKKLFEAEA